MVIVSTRGERVEELFSCIRSLRFLRHRERDNVDPRVVVAFEEKAVDALRFLVKVVFVTAVSEVLLLVAVVAARAKLFIIFRSASFSVLKTVSSILFCRPSACSFL